MVDSNKPRLWHRKGLSAMIAHRIRRADSPKRALFMVNQVAISVALDVDVLPARFANRRQHIALPGVGCYPMTSR